MPTEAFRRYTSEERIAKSENDERHIREESFIKRIAPIFTIISAIVAVSALFLNTSVRRRGVSCTYVGSDSMIQVDKGALPGPLTITYQGRPIDALYTLKFTVRNTGSSAIKDTDIKEPLALSFPRGFTLIGEPSVQTRPPFSISTQVDPANASRILLSFPLMNSGDEANISVNALSLGQGSPVLSGRIVDVKQITNFDLSKARLDHKNGQRLSPQLVWSLTVLIGLLGAASLFFFAWSSFIFIRDRSWRVKWREEAERVWQRVDEKKIASFQELLAQRDAALKSAGIPSKPIIGFDLKDYLQIGPPLFVLTALFGFTTYALFVFATS